MNDIECSSLIQSENEESGKKSSMTSPDRPIYFCMSIFEMILHDFRLEDFLRTFEIDWILGQIIKNWFKYYYISNTHKFLEAKHQEPRFKWNLSSFVLICKHHTTYTNVKSALFNWMALIVFPFSIPPVLRFSKSFLKRN